ncbi:MAG: hydroxysqualene dehydroxylase HpnE [Thiobacillus sp.]
MTRPVAVVGGGWAGCAAALTLAEAGVDVALFEASRTLGGRARATVLDGRLVDNGQHMLLGAYTTTLDLLNRLGGHKTDRLWRRPLRLDAPPAFSLACPRWPAPLNLLAGFVAARGLSWQEKWSALQWSRRLLAGLQPPAGSTVAVLTRRQPARVNQLLWHPLCVAALNTPADAACARAFAAVLRGALGGPRTHSDFLLPRCDLSALFPLPAAERIQALGGTVHTGQRVRAVEAGHDAVTLRINDTAPGFSRVIIAVAPQHLHALTEYIRELDSVRRMVAQYTYQPIATAYFQFDPGFRLPHPVLALTGGPAQYVFDRGHSHGQAGLLACVASAATNLPNGWIDQVEAQLRHIVSPGPVLWRRAIVEKQATYGCVPDLPRPSAGTPHPLIFLAGDYIAGPYPATLESATMSGVQSAHALLNSL